MRWSWIATLSSCLLLSVPASGQFSQYTAPGGPEGRPESLQERLEGAMEEARWRLGPVRLEPWFGLRDVGWVDDLAPAEDAEAEAGGDGVMTATAGAGLKAYLPTGPKVVWAAHLLPEYVWTQDRDELSDVNGRFGIGFFGSFNRLQLQATATRSQELGIVSSEFLERINARGEAVSLEGELRVAGSLYLFGSVTVGRADHLDRIERGASGPDFDLLDREERVTRAGLSFRTRGGWAVGAGAERSEVDFDEEGADRSNSGTSPLVVISSPAEGRLYLGIDLVFRSLEPEDDSAFVAYEGVTGGVHLQLGDRESRFAPGVYARRDVVYALTPPFSYFEADRTGVSLSLRFGWRTGLRIYGEAGRDVYTAADPAFAREDDVIAFGAGVDFGLYRGSRLTLGFSREEADSDLAGEDRSVTYLRGGLAFGGGPSPWY